MSSPIAYSYLRFSHPSQTDGDSIRRQTAKTVEWVNRNGVILDTTFLTLQDKGVSGFRGRHRSDRHCLGQFLKLVERGRIQPGSYLLVENLDRLSREEEVPACHLLTSILMAGIKVVQLMPAELVLTDKSPGWDIMRAVMELARGHNESKAKSERVGAAWEQKRRQLRDRQQILTHRLPAWMEVRGGKPVLISERAAAVRRIFHLAATGYGHALIVRQLEREGIAPMGEADHWARSYIALILSDRRALGEFQPRTRKGEPAGEVVRDYYPAVVSEDDWHAAQAGAQQRRQKPGRTSETFVNLFSGMLIEGTTGSSLYAATRSDGGKHTKVLIPTDAAEGRAPTVSFPLRSFERAVLALLREVDPREIIETNGHDEVSILEGQLAALDARIGALEAELATGDVPSLARALRGMESERKDVAERLSAAQQAAANPLSSAWGEARGLLEVLDSAPDPQDARLRLRAILRRIIASIYVVMAARGRTRLAIADLYFTGERMRTIAIRHVPPRANASGRTAGSIVAISVTGTVAAQPNDNRRFARAVAQLERGEEPRGAEYYSEIIP